MKLLIIGSGGREHAITYKAAQSDSVSQIFVAPGNAGTRREPKTENVDIDMMDFEKLIDFAKKQHIDLTIVGPEAPLAAGIVDAFAKHKLACFGPNQQAAQLEASKAFAKDFLVKHQIPTANSATFTDIEEARSYIQSHPLPMVIKADGLCAGKGVVIANTIEQALATCDDMLQHRRFNDASSKIVVEEFLEGEEASYIILTDGKTIFPFATSQDHKARDNGDKGPNTGGMGAYSPAPVIDNQLDQTIIETIVAPTINGLQQDNIEFKGFLYVGLMITKDGPKVLEFNCRLGDPEAQVLLMRLDNDLVELINATLTGDLGQMQPKWRKQTAVGVVMAAHGYPDAPRKGDVIEGLNDLPSNPQYKVFHAGTTIKQGKIETSGGRVLCVCATGSDVIEAQFEAYQLLNKISFNGAFWRTDIASKAIDRVELHA